MFGTNAYGQTPVDSPAVFDISSIMKILEVIDALAALAQEHRLAAFRLLVQAGEAGLAAGAIADQLDVPNSSLSFHLAHLTRAGLIRQRRQSRSLIYSADFAATAALVGYLTENCCGGRTCDAIATVEASAERTAA
jgi:ArsR family transcriptional regulator, arsenate/arsenite/antimonite-responsive transcriptional repressor